MRSASLWVPLPRLFDRACDLYSGRVAVVAGNRSVTYEELRAWRNRVSNGLCSLGVGKGDRVGLYIPNCLEFLPTQHGIWRSGAVQIQMAAKAGTNDIEYFLRSTGAETLIFHEDFDGIVRTVVDRGVVVPKMIRVGTSPHDLDALAYDELFGTQSSEDPTITGSP